MYKQRQKQRKAFSTMSTYRPTVVPTIWEWFPLFLSYHRKKHCGRNRIDHGRPCEQGSPSWFCIHQKSLAHHSDFIMGAMASQITSLNIVCSTVYSGADQRKHQSSASLAFVRGNHWWPVNSPYKWPVTRKMLPFDDVIMINLIITYVILRYGP